MADEIDRARDKRVPNTMDVRVGLRIRERRTELGMIQETLADQLQISPQQLSRYEMGKDRVSPTRLFELSAILRVPIGWFFDDGKAMPSDGRMGAPAIEDLRDTERKELLRAFDQIKPNHQRRLLIDLARELARLELGH